VTFGIIFTVELSLKLAAVGLKAFKEVWTWLDCAIIGFWLVEQASQGLLPVDPKIIRVARLARLLRFLKVVKTIQAFDSLYLMVQAIKSSFSALFWSSIVLLLTEMMLALVLNLLLESAWTSETVDDDTRLLIYQYFGTFTKAFQTMIEMLLGNWYSITRLLTENVSEYYLIFGICHQLILGFAVIEVITGVFLHQTFTVASMDDSIMMNEMKRVEKEQTKKINRFFEAADEDGSGTMDEQEFLELIDKQSTRDWLSAMGLPVHTFPNAFSMFDGPNGDGEITADKMAQAASRMKGQATAFELAIVRNMVEDIARAMKQPSSPQPSPRRGA
jgi:Ca2+-binding EF-hand superfamily protein